ncbi:hypothetical protein BVRB_013800 isoform B [Beta vulgaris subsp. vulgaris]|uniref:Uncharacterized protein n=1 Tax=Beta vulgaris subsp. vulgaris TaxID=3555 RepID=A0A0J8B1T7_BETVV|nr:hypothetical protein BVRB_013800 isoform B [Beta vulgaris subsp. vulgaris]
MEEKTAKSEIHLPILPDDLIVEQILPRLPVHFWLISGQFLFSVASIPEITLLPCDKYVLLHRSTFGILSHLWSISLLC